MAIFECPSSPERSQPLASPLVCKKPTHKLLYFTPLKLQDLSSCSVDETDGHAKELRKSLRTIKYSIVDVLANLISILAFIGDVATDLYIFWRFLAAGQKLEAYLVLGFWLGPSILTNLISLFWILGDYKKYRHCKKGVIALQAVVCVFQFGPTLWYCTAIYFGTKFVKLKKALMNRKSQMGKDKKHEMLVDISHAYLRTMENERDATLMRTFEAFLESAPQMMIQGYILCFSVQNGRPFEWIQVVSIFLSLCSVSWSLIAQHRCLRLSRPDKRMIRWYGSVLQFFWRFFTILSKSMTFIVFTLVFEQWVLVLLGWYYIVLLLFMVFFQRIDIGDHKFIEVIILGVVAFVHLFTPLNIKEGATRLRYLFWYFLEFINICLVISLCLAVKTFVFPLKIYFICAIPVFYGVGLLFFGVYYKFCHPTLLRKRSNSKKKSFDTKRTGESDAIFNQILTSN